MADNKHLIEIEVNNAVLLSKFTDMFKPDDIIIFQFSKINDKPYVKIIGKNSLNDTKLVSYTINDMKIKSFDLNNKLIAIRCGRIFKYLDKNNILNIGCRNEILTIKIDYLTRNSRSNYNIKSINDNSDAQEMIKIIKTIDDLNDKKSKLELQKRDLENELDKLKN